MVRTSRSQANAIAGTMVDLTGAAAMTLKVVPDDLEGEVVLKTGGSQGRLCRRMAPDEDKPRRIPGNALRA